MSEEQSPEPTVEVIQQKSGQEQPVNFDSLAKVAQTVIGPILESQKFAAQENTKQTEIVMKARVKAFWAVCALATLVLVLAGYSLWLGKDQTAEKIIIAIVGFLGGMGFGRQMSNSA